MYPYRHSKKALVLIFSLGILGSIFLSIWKSETRPAQAYFSQDEAQSERLSNITRGDPSGILNQVAVQSSVVDVRVSTGANDAEERVSDGYMYLGSTDLELVNDPSVTNGIQSIGMRFTGVNIPQGATITQAYVEFEVDETSSEATSLTLYGQPTDNPAAFTTTAHNISSRPKTAASVSWSSLPSWATVGAKVQSPDIKSIVQAIVSRSGWASGNSLVLFIEGSGRRVAAAYEVGAAKAALLHVAYTLSSNTPTATPLSFTATPPPNTPTPLSSTPTPLSSTPTPPPSTPVPTSTQSAPTPLPPSEGIVVDTRVSARADDAEQNINSGRMYLASSDLELVYDPGVTKASQSVGVRFNSLNIPKGSTIVQAYLEFEVDAVSSEATSLKMYGQASDNATAFTRTDYDVSRRTKTTAMVSWNNIPAWTTVGAKVQSPDLTGVIQEIVNRNGWKQGNSLALIMEGSGRRVAAAYEESPTKAARLRVVYLPLISATPTPTSAPPSQPTPVGQTGTWNLIFNDDFNGSALDSTKWRTCFWWADVTCTIESNNEMELYNPQDVLVQNGLLRLRAQKRDMVAWNGATYHYTSGMVMTGGRGGSNPTPPGFSFLYGYAEALVKIPAGQGLWPAFWTLSMSYDWPPEIDIMEILGHTTSEYHMNYHYVGGNAGTTWTGPDFSTGWHVLGLDWGPTAIKWYVDGVERWRFTDASKITNEVSYLLLNLAVGGNWPGPPNSNTPFPSYYDIDYVRVWQR